MRPHLRSFSAALASLVMLWSVTAFANPTFDHAEAGSVTISENGGVYNIYSADRSIGAFQSFSNAAGETINSIQASSSDTALFRVIGTEPSSIFGNLNANSHIFLVNPNGILFGPGSQVNAPGLVASTLALANADFLADRFVFQAGPVAGALLNQGTLHAGQGGYVALLGSSVRNEGTILAPEGSVAIGAGNAATLTLDSQGLISVRIDKPIEAAVYDMNGNKVNDAIANPGTIQADGGAVFLSAQAAEEVFDNAINLTGVVQANDVQEKNGVVSLVSDGDIQATGTFSTDHLYERGGTFLVGGIVHIGQSDIQNLDGALAIASGTYNNSTFTDPGDILVNANAAVTFTGTSNKIESTGGSLKLQAGSVVTAAGANLSIDIDQDFDIFGGVGANGSAGGATGAATSFTGGSSGTIIVGNDLNILGGAAGNADGFSTTPGGNGGSATFAQGAETLLVGGDLNLTGGNGGSANGGVGGSGTNGTAGGAGQQGVPESSGAAGLAGSAGTNGGPGPAGGVGGVGGAAIFSGGSGTAIIGNLIGTSGNGGSAIGGNGANGSNGANGGNGGNGGSSGAGGAGGAGGKGGNGGNGGAGGTGGAGGALNFTSGTGVVIVTGTLIQTSQGTAGSTAAGTNGTNGTTGTNGTAGSPLIGAGGAGGTGGLSGTAGLGGAAGTAGVKGAVSANLSSVFFFVPTSSTISGLDITGGHITGGEGIDDFTAATSTLYSDETLPEGDDTEKKDEDPTGAVTPEAVSQPTEGGPVEDQTPADTPLNASTFSPCGG